MSKKPEEKTPNPSTKKTFPENTKPNPTPIIPGEILLGEHDIVAFEGRATITLTVVNHGDRPIQVGSHCHFFEVNRALRFDREQAFGFRLKIPSGTAVRFEPGEEKRVSLVAFGGNRIAYGINGLTNGSLDDDKVKAQALTRAAQQGFIVEGVGS
jgi:urease beta subunit